MTTLNIKRTTAALEKFEFTTLFIEELGWNNPVNPRPVPFQVNGQSFTRQEIAQLAGVTVFEIDSGSQLPDAPTRRQVHQDIAKFAYENLLIFVAQNRSQSLWYWVKRQDRKALPRDHYYFRGQPADLFLTKLESLVFDLKEIAANPTVTDVANRLRDALDVERVTKKFYADYQLEHLKFIEYIQGISDERQRRWYASVLLNRLMFIYFLQRKRFLDKGNLDYLQDKFAESQATGPDLYYSNFLKTLFFEGFAKPATERRPQDNALLGDIPYLNGGLFLPHKIEQDNSNITIPNIAFQNLLDLFKKYSWNLDDTPGGQSDEINPDVLGYIFEKYINQKAFGAYYTRPEITEYLCRQTIHNLILAQVNTPGVPGSPVKSYHFDTLPDLIMKLDAPLCRALYTEILPSLKLLDPACGSGAFLVAALKTMLNIYFAVIGAIDRLNVPGLKAELDDLRRAHHSLSYYIKKKIITENLYGVDIMEEAADIARLRLFLTLVASARTVDELEPLPNIDFNILPGNSLVGLLDVNQAEYDSGYSQTNMFRKPYHVLVAEKNAKVQSYRDASTYTKDLQALRDDIEDHRREALSNLNSILLDDFSKKLGIKFEQATWDTTKNTEGAYVKRPLRPADIENLHPFHWGFEFDQVMNRSNGGFDAIITNPPWEIFKPQAKEFLQEHSELVTINKMTIKEFEEEQARILQDPKILAEWIDYLSRFPYLSAYYRSAPQYLNQISIVNGKKAGTDINLYKLFTEQCYNLLRSGGQCGIVIPSGIYTDLGTKQLRELLFDKTCISGLFCFENRKTIFEGVDSRFKFVVLTYEKGGHLSPFPTAFMRLDVAELERFPGEGALYLTVDLIRKLSPDSLSITEFNSAIDITIAQKMLRFPLLGEKISDKWNLVLSNEFHMTNDSKLFKTAPAPDRLPMYEGKMAHQFTHILANPRYWIIEKEGRKAILGQVPDIGQKLDYQDYRMGFRRIARNTDTRTMIATILPKNFFASESFNLSTGPLLTYNELLGLVAILNSFTLDYCLRQRVSAHINMFYVYQLPVPRLTESDPEFRPIVERAVRLICTTSEFKDLWEAVMPGQPWSPNVAATGDVERGQLRAELDGLIAHLYGLTEAEFVHILGTFPLVPAPVKVAAQNAYRDFAPKTEDAQLLQTIRQGETDQVEFKRIASTNRDKIVQGIAAFLNSPSGGTMLIGVEDDGTIVGVESDYPTVNPGKPNADSYQMFLQQIINSSLADDFALCYNITFHRLAGREVCQIKIKPAPKPAYLKNGDFYRRNGNQKDKLSPKATQDYIQQRWG
jgi:hypothetical protein